MCTEEEMGYLAGDEDDVAMWREMTVAAEAARVARMNSYRNYEFACFEAFSNFGESFVRDCEFYPVRWSQ